MPPDVLFGGYLKFNSEEIIMEAAITAAQTSASTAVGAAVAAVVAVAALGFGLSMVVSWIRK